ncbi:hypothetical protein NUM_52540 [Actinocatenispora comari]|uniref:Uncharacterized protein n=1 Tax=Actinocatenispora comari TaxID=2807577 RepID=A0A8J4AG33_9ACTN|nr:hypothetical protein NUM_52540 [Actinocatenispora comari]
MTRRGPEGEGCAAERAGEEAAGETVRGPSAAQPAAAMSTAAAAATIVQLRCQVGRTRVAPVGTALRRATVPARRDIGQPYRQLCRAAAIR